MYYVNEKSIKNQFDNFGQLGKVIGHPALQSQALSYRDSAPQNL